MTLLPNDNKVTPAEQSKGTGNELFPVFIKLHQLHTVVIGAGKVGLEKLTAVLTNSPQARVTVIAREILPEIHALAANNKNVTVINKAFAEYDLDKADLVIAGTNDNNLNEYIVQAAHDRKLLVNIADKPELCDFYLSSIVHKGNLKIAISTNGKSPTIAKRIKEFLNREIPDEIDDTLEHMSALRDNLKGDFAYKVKKLNEATAILSAAPRKAAPNHKMLLRWGIWLTSIACIVISLVSLWYKEPDFQAYVRDIDPMFYYFLGAGFVFAMIDGAIGMSYGVTSTTFSLSMGVPPASASMAVHLSEVLSNGIAGWMHYRMGNVNWKLFKLLLIPGIIGAVTGAYLLSSLEHYSQYTRPFVSAYTLILGIVILSKAFNRKPKKSADKIKKISLLGLGGGFIDAVGGGGWGSIVLSTLIAGGRHARFSLGTVKLSRFFIALMSSLTFVTMLKSAHWDAVAGLIIGSALASPIAAKISNRISSKVIMVAVGIIVVLISIRSIANFVIKVL
ncbi:siroheme synthase [Mucilaginibacter limnophilus]|uniref:Probable membrane transporter protein n=1 Tax=Mucilaginibacter limnophilus TaxID=1932778 RepID=A0A437MI10_9SPHI|nr:TSUP family transporter [Mucilaginibacter limnophilus]RVT97263.1 siroheme synthase [Mucilaginibacter limnophilus]